MATIVKTPAGTWKAVIRKTGWPTNAKTFRTKRDAEDWSRRTEDEMVRGVYIQRSGSERMTLEKALQRYLADVTPTKKPSTRKAETTKAKQLIQNLGKYSLAALSAEIIADYRDSRLASTSKHGRPISNNTVRLELALLSHLYTVAIKEWGLGLTFNPVLNIRKPRPGPERDRRLAGDEERRLFAALNDYSNPMLRWIAVIALETVMRSSEITGLRCHQVNLQKRVAFLPDTKNGSPREVPLNEIATEAFRDALDNPTRPNDCDLIFFGEPGKDGKRRPYAFTKTWGLLKRKLGMSDFRFHDFRHEGISRYAERGLSAQKLAALSGHKSMQQLKRYTHLRGEDLVRDLDALPKRRPTT
ncbi:site-specific integrase [Pseudomonas aeruginosa]|uniref:tyrosine-type recombinase/integrase n=1 Tax=Pseudomonas aeruginosa TaxID=287 RepID=UPI0009A25B11|nr:site-specific integrase [Pseudomonas aeruginosa]OPF30755.1 phage integrase [Pseudomonas aeruginosa P47]OPF32305.1 phage integrase [Pseudomonas aeruginosa P37]OPF35461.1 phage integrase [Pseudomonas aeruginosa SD9]OPF46028.1 phage integrase [Pseudomonas aeruginosa P49]HBO5018996.1 tyrosine-type recombinase/integrase [Pseudomonas aeruginosa]